MTSLTSTYTLYVRAGVQDAKDASSSAVVAPPTTSLGCLTVWLALGLAGKAAKAGQLRVVECAWETSSPSGMLPCLERVSGDTRALVGVGRRAAKNANGGNGAGGAPAEASSGPNDMDAADAILDALFTPSASRSSPSTTGTTGTTGTTATASSADLALRALVAGSVIPGVSTSLWGDEKCYDVLATSVYGGRLPWPLRKWLARAAQRRHVGGVVSAGEKSRDVLVRRAVEALNALSRSIGEDDEKMSVRTRALLAATCLTVRCLPVGETLRVAARGMDAWVDGVVRAVVVDGKVGRAMPAALADARWARARAAAAVVEDFEGEEDAEGEAAAMDRTSRYWLVGIGGLAALYAAMLLRESVELVVADE